MFFLVRPHIEYEFWSVVSSSYHDPAYDLYECKYWQWRCYGQYRVGHSLFQACRPGILSLVSLVHTHVYFVQQQASPLSANGIPYRTLQTSSINSNKKRYNQGSEQCRKWKRMDASGLNLKYVC